MVQEAAWRALKQELDAAGAVLVAVSKTKPAADIRELYALGQRDFGENYVQELCAKQAELPADIRWHFIGHLQSNKVKQIAPFVHLIHSVDSASLLKEIDKQAARNGRKIEVLLQIHIAREETKFGLDAAELEELIAAVSEGKFPHIKVRGLMGMASFTEDREAIRAEFGTLKSHYERCREALKDAGFDTLSMGMSSDFRTALEAGSNMVRVGSLLFGSRS